MLGSGTNGLNFRMRTGIVVLDTTIKAFADNLVVQNHHRTHRNFALLCRFIRKLKACSLSWILVNGINVNCLSLPMGRIIRFVSVWVSDVMYTSINKQH